MVTIIDALEESDDRRVELAIASPSALLVAKLHKIADRQSTPGRLGDKDALDVYRLLQALPTESFIVGISKLLHDPRSREVTQEALVQLRVFFGSPTASGPQMAARAAEPEDPDTISASCAFLAGDVLAAIRS